MAKYRADSLYRNTKVVSNQYLDTLDLASIDIDNTSTKTVTIPKNRPPKTWSTVWTPKYTLDIIIHNIINTPKKRKARDWK